jgi:hypothetical protein
LLFENENHFCNPSPRLATLESIMEMYWVTIIPTEHMEAL